MERCRESEEGRQQRGPGEGKRRDVTLAPAYLPPVTWAICGYRLFPPFLASSTRASPTAHT